MFCGNCGNELREGARFCPKCGAVTRLGRQQNQPPAEPEPAGIDVPAAEPAVGEDAAPAPRQQVRQRPAAGKAKPAVRLKAMPVKPAQEEQPAQQAEPAKPVSPPPAPEPAEPPQQPAAPAQPSFLETGAARLASAVGGVKDALGGESVQCGSCGTKLKAGTKFCPECGAAVTQPPKAEPAPAPDGQNSKGTVFRALNQFDGTRAKNREEQAPQMGAAAETKSKAAPSKGRIIFFAAAGVFVVVIALLAALGGGGKTSYADGLVEADNEFGLSTTMTLKEFVERYNEDLASHGLNDSLFWIDLEDGETIVSTPASTEYSFMFPGASITRLKRHMNIAVDNETGYVMSVILRYTNSGYESATDSQRTVVDTSFMALFDVLCKGDSNKLSETIEIMEKIQSSGGYVHWEDGILYVKSGDEYGFTNIGFQTMAKEVYEEKYGQ